MQSVNLMRLLEDFIEKENNLKKLNSYIREAYNLFNQKTLDSEFFIYLNHLNKYYQEQFKECSTNNQRRALVGEYAQLLELMKKIQGGSSTVEEALKKFNNITRAKKINTVIENIFKICEILCWLAITIFLAGIDIAAGSSLLSSHPLLGVVFIAAMSAYTLAAGAHLIDLINSFKFKNFKSIEQYEKLSRNLVCSFFSSKKEENSIDNAENCSENYELSCYL